VACRGEKRSTYTALVLKPEGKRPLGRPRHRWDSTDWINQGQDRNKSWAVVNMVLDLRLHKMQDISQLGEVLLASQEGPCFTEFVS
jgi:hypothetical protein